MTHCIHANLILGVSGLACTQEPINLYLIVRKTCCQAITPYSLVLIFRKLYVLPRQTFNNKPALRLVRAHAPRIIIQPRMIYGTNTMQFRRLIYLLHIHEHDIHEASTYIRTASSTVPQMMVTFLTF